MNCEIAHYLSFQENPTKGSIFGTHTCKSFKKCKDCFSVKSSIVITVDRVRFLLAFVVLNNLGKGVILFLLLLLAASTQSCMLVAGLYAHEKTTFDKSSAEQVKAEKAIIGVEDYPNNDSKKEKVKDRIDDKNKVVSDILENNWYLSPVSDVKLLHDAEKFIRKNKEYYCISIRNYLRSSYDQSGSNTGPSIRIKNYSTGALLQLSSGKMIGFPVPFTDNETYINSISALAAAKSLQEIIRQIEAGVIKSHRDMADNHNRKTKALENKILLLPEFLYDAKLGLEGINKYYKYRIEVCSNQKYEEAILKGLEGYVIPLLSTENIGYGYVEHLSFWDSKTWECYALFYYKGWTGSNRSVFGSKDYKDGVRIKKKEWKQIKKKLRS